MNQEVILNMENFKSFSEIQEDIQRVENSTLNDLRNRSAVNDGDGVMNRQQKRNYIFSQPMGDDVSNRSVQKQKAKSKTRAKNKNAKKARKRK